MALLVFYIILGPPLLAIYTATRAVQNIKRRWRS